MALQLGQLSTLPTTAASLGNLVLGLAQSLNKNIVGVQPQDAPLPVNFVPNAQANAIIFDYEGEQSVTLESDITDHYVEDNSAIQDQIAIRPELITTHGYIGELNDILPASLQFLQTAAQSISYISGYAPSLSVTALNALNQATQAYNTANQLANLAVGTWKSIVGGKSQNKQQEKFNQFYGYWQNRTLFTVQTPWNLFVNCAIKSLRAMQDENTQIVTDFEITFKVLRFSNTVIAGGVQLGQSYFNNYLAQNSPLKLGASAPLNLGANLGSLTGGL